MAHLSCRCSPPPCMSQLSCRWRHASCEPAFNRAALKQTYADQPNVSITPLQAILDRCTLEGTCVRVQQGRQSEAERRKTRNQLLSTLKHVPISTLPQFQDIPIEPALASTHYSSQQQASTLPPSHPSSHGNAAGAPSAARFDPLHVWAAGAETPAAASSAVLHAVPSPGPGALSSAATIESAQVGDRAASSVVAGQAPHAAVDLATLDPGLSAWGQDAAVGPEFGAELPGPLSEALGRAEGIEHTQQEQAGMSLVLGQSCCEPAGSRQHNRHVRFAVDHAE